MISALLLAVAAVSVPDAGTQAIIDTHKALDRGKCFDANAIIEAAAFDRAGRPRRDDLVQT